MKGRIAVWRQLYPGGGGPGCQSISQGRGRGEGLTFGAGEAANLAMLYSLSRNAAVDCDKRIQGHGEGLQFGAGEVMRGEERVGWTRGAGELMPETS